MATVNPSKHTSSKSSRKRSAYKVHTLPLATTAALLTAATCLGSQPAMAVTADAIITPSQDGVINNLMSGTATKYQDREYVPLGDKKPWLQHPNILQFRRVRGRNSNATEIKSDVEGSDTNWKAVNDKTAMYAHVETRDNSDYLVFDVFFNNNAKSMISKSDRQWYLWQVPYAIADLGSDGLYKSDTVTNLRYDAYRPKKEGHILSQDPEAFEKDDSLSFSVSDMRKKDVHFGKDNYALYQVGIGLNPGNKVYDDLDQIFHGNANESLISRMAGDQTTYAFNNGSQYKRNYGLGITVAKPYDNVAYHMHAELKLRPGAINKNADNYNDKYAKIQNAWTWANSGSYGATTSSAYTVISGRDPENDEDKDGKLGRNKTDSIAPKIYYNGKEIANKTKPIKLSLHTGDKLKFSTTDNKGYIEKFSISGLTDTPITKQGAGSEDKPLSSDEITVTEKMHNKTVTITSEDGSGNVTTRKVKVTVKKKTLADEHPLTGKTINTTVGEKLPELTEIDKFVDITDKANLKEKPTLKWNGLPGPNTDKVGVFTHSIKGTYSDNSTSITKPVVTINVKPKKPVIETDLTNLAGKKGQKVTVTVVGDGIPKDEKVTTTVKLFDKNGNEIGSTTTISNGKAEITVKDGIPEGDVYATTTVKKPDKRGPKTTIPGFELTSEKSDTKKATAPKDAQDPTITATAESSSVTVGQDLKIHIVAKDDVQVDDVPNAQALAQGLGLELNELSSRIKSSQTTDTDTEKDFDLTVKNMQPKEVGTHTITFTVKDSAGNTGSTTLTITVKPEAPAVNTPTSGDGQGSATITPAKDTDTLEITYTPEGDNKEKTITVTKGADNKWKKGDDTPEGVTVNENTGEVTIPANKIKDGSSVSAIDKKGKTSSDKTTGTTGTNPTAPETKPEAPAVNTPTSGDGQGSATITPAKDTDTLEITYTPEGDNKEKTITVTKGADNKWKKGDDTPEGVTVNENTGEVTIPANKIKDGSSVSAIDKKGKTSSDKTTGNAGKNPAAPATKPAAPKVEPQNDGSVNVTPADGTDTLEITYTPEDGTEEKTITVKKGGDGNWTGTTPDGVTVDKATGKVTIPANKVKDGSDVKAKDKKGNDTSEEATGKAKDNPTTPATKPAAPKVEPQNDGSVNVTPADGTDTLEITYTPEDGTEEKTITVKKGGDGNWTGTTPDGVTVDKATGKVTIPADKVKDDSDVTAVDKKGDTSSDSATGKAGKNPGNSGSGTGSGTGSDSGSGSETGNSNSSESDSGNDSTPNNGDSDNGSTTGGSSSTDSDTQNSTGASTKPGDKVSAKRSSQLVKTGDEFEQVGLISAMIGLLGAVTALFSRKMNRDQKAHLQK